MLEKICGIVGKILTPTVTEILIVILTFLPIVTFLVSLFFGKGLLGKINRGFKKVKKGAKKSNEELKKAIDELPSAVKNLVENSRFAGALPTEHATFSACVIAPSATCPRIKFALTVALSTLICAFAQSILCGFTLLVFVTLMLGGTLSLVSAILANSFIRRVENNYYDAMKLIDENFVQEMQDDAPTVEAEPEIADASIDFDIEENGIKEENSRQNFDDLDLGESDAFDYAKTVYADENDFIDGKEFASDFVDGKESEFIDDETEGDDLEMEDVIERVEQIATYGATIDEMKEVASLLRSERAKLQNRTPSRRKRLDDAFASLLRSVSNAKK